MTYARFHKIASSTSKAFWPLVYLHVTPEEATYLRSTPSARRNLDRRLVLALAHSLLTADQISNSVDFELDDPQTHLQETPP